MITNEVLLLLKDLGSSSANRLIAEGVQVHSEDFRRHVVSVLVHETGKNVPQMPSGLVEKQRRRRLDLF